MHTAQKADSGVASAVSAAVTALPSSRVLTLDGGDTYHGAVQIKNGLALPHGRGVWRSQDGELQYEGHFVQRWRDGYGRLITPTYTLWAHWRMDRPDLSSAVRVDYANGDRYGGFIEWMSQPSSTAARAGAPSRSKFAAWVATVRPSRTRWGECVQANGDTYVGEWRHDERDGVGCYVWASGSRYTGRFCRGHFHDIGTLFVAATEVEGCVTRLSSGMKRWCGGQSSIVSEEKTTTTFDVGAVQAAVAAQGCVLARWPPLARPAWDGVVVDVVWVDGRVRGEGHVTLPGGARVSAEWRTASSPVMGELVLPSLTPQARVDPEVYEWHESFQWEALFHDPRHPGGSGSAAEEERVFRTRVNIQQSNSAEFVKSCVLELLNTHELTKTTLHVFRRCFYTLYGTCGDATEIGAGSRCEHGGSSGSNGLGWCSLRNQYGGCIHHPTGRPIQAGDLDLALRDIASLARSTVRWALSLLGDEVQAKVLDCGGEAVMGRWVADRVFQHCYPVLLNLYKQVYAAEEATLAAAVARLRSTVSLDDMGILFARQSASQARLFDPYTDAVHCVEQLNGDTQTLTKLLKVLVQWSREIDLSTRLTQASQAPPSTSATAGDGGRGAGKAGKKKASSSSSISNNDAVGSADDLLPIHQYVLSQSRCTHIFAVTKLLADFASEALFMEATSQEAFGVTTLQVCVLTLMRLHPCERDAAKVLVPFTVALDRVTEAAGQCAVLAEWVCTAAASTGAAEAEAAVEAAQLMAFMVPYASVWVPRMVGWIGEHVGPGDAAAFFAVADCELTDEERSLAQLTPSLCGAASICCGCWLYAGVLLGSVHLRLFLDDVPLPSQLQSAAEVKDACAVLREHLRYGEAPLQLRVGVEPGVRLIPSRLARMEVHISELLSLL